MIEKTLTRLELLHHADTEWTCDWHYLAHMRITDTETGRFIRLHFIVWFDSADLLSCMFPEGEVPDGAIVTDNDIKNMAKEMALCNMDVCPDTMDIWKIRQFVADDINPEIERYNRGNRYLRRIRPYAV